MRSESSTQINTTRTAEDYYEPTEYANTTSDALQPDLTINRCDLGKYIQTKSMSEFKEEFEVSAIYGRLSFNLDNDKIGTILGKKYSRVQPRETFM